MKYCSSAALVAILTFAPFAEASAAASSDGKRDIVVTATRSGTTLDDLATSVSVVSEEELAKQLDYDTNIMRALELTVPGIAPQREARANCSPNIRGRQTSIQINGIPVNENIRQSTCNQMYQLSPFAIERVEVLRGGTALYGAGSPGGIINFVTRRAKGPDLEIDLVAQTSFNTSKLDESFTTDLYAGAGQKLDGWDYYLGAAYTDGGVGRTPDGGFVPARTYESFTLNGSLGADLFGGEFRLTGTWYREDKGQEYSADGTQDIGNFAPVFPIDSHPQLEQDVLRSTTLALSYNHPEVLGHSLAVSGYYQNQIYRQRDNFFDVNFGGNDFFASDSDHDRFGFRSTLVKNANFGNVEFVGSYGFDYTYNSYYRPVVDPTNGMILGLISPEVKFSTYAVFGQAELDFGRFRLVGGARQEWYRGKVGTRGFDPALPGAATPGDFGKTSLALFNIGGVFDVTENIQVYGGFSQGAEISQLGRAARNAVNPSLITPEPATSDQFELGVRGQAGAARFELAGFKSSSDKASLLQADPSCAGETLCPLIPLRARQRFWGFEGSVDWAVSEALDLGAVVTYQRGKIFDEDLGRFIQYSTDIVAPFRMTGSASYRPMERLRLSLQGTYYGAANYYTTAEEALGFVNTDSVFLMDASIHYKLAGGEVYLAASNLLDENYVAVADQGVGFFNYKAEGRRVTVGYRARF
jgi:iron complex outermembrane recepter protein